MNITFLFLLLPLLLIIPLASSQCSCSCENDLRIRQTCNRTDHFSLCFSTLASDLRSFKADVKGLSHITLEKLLANANAAHLANSMALIGNFFDIPPSLGPGPTSFYCCNAYDYGLVKKAISALEAKHYGAARKDVMDFANIAQRCIESYRNNSQLAYSSAFYNQNNQVRDLSYVASSLISGLLSREGE